MERNDAATLPPVADRGVKNTPPSRSSRALFALLGGAGVPVSRHVGGGQIHVSIVDRVR
jgi:hypothetical protein